MLAKEVQAGQDDWAEPEGFKFNERTIHQNKKIIIKLKNNLLINDDIEKAIRIHHLYWMFYILNNN